MNDRDADDSKRIEANFREFSAEVDQACIAAGRKRDEVLIIGVTKYVGPRQTQLLVQAGCTHLGESRPQTLWQKAESPMVSEAVHWHMIGHVQRNKVKRMLRRPVCVHSIDSQRVLDALNDDGIDRGARHECLIEVNISGDPDKTGLNLESAERILANYAQQQTNSDSHTPGASIIGLMAMASRRDEAGPAGKQFENLRSLRDRWSLQYGVPLPELSMGMTQDFVEAIQAGATMLRVGSRLFDGVNRDPE